MSIESHKIGRGQHQVSDPACGLSHMELLRVLETFVECSSEIVSISDADLDHPDGPVMLYSNPAGLLAAGYAADEKEFIGRRLSTIYGPEALPRMLDLLRSALVTNRPVSAESAARRRNGMTFWVEIRAIPVPDATGRITHFIRIGRDITARKHAEIQRENTQRLLASVFGVMDQALCVVDDMGKIALVNRAFTRHLGWSVAELMGKSWIDTLDEADRERVRQEMLSSLTRSCRIEARLRHKDGSLQAGTIVSTVLQQPDERLYHVLTFTADAAPAAESFEAPPAAAAPRMSLATVSRALREPVYSPGGRPASFCLLRLPGILQQKLDQSHGIVIDEDGVPVDTDCMMLSLAAAEAGGDDIAGIRSSFGIPVDYSLFDSKSRIDAYLKLCEGLSQAQRARLVIILQHVPPNTHRDRIATIVQMLRPFTRHIGFEHVELGGAHKTRTRHDATLVTIAADRITRLAPPRLEDMVSQIHLEGAKILVHHVPAGIDLAALGKAGIDLVCGNGAPS